MPWSTESLVRAGAELADEVGFEAVTGSALARRVGVKQASLYAHVASTDALRAGIGMLALAEMADRAADAVAGRGGRDALVALADVYRDYAREHPGRYRAAQQRFSPEQAAAGAGPRHATLTRAILRDYRLEEPDQTHAVRLVGSVVRGFVELEQAGSFDHTGADAPSAQASWDRTLDALDTLLRSWHR